jgi:hypothetical protein
MPDKQQLTQQLLNQLPADDRPSFEWALKSWWQDLRDDGGLRLSISGYDVFKFLSIEQYEFDFTKVLSPSLLMTLNRKLDCPYYIKVGKTPRLIMFGSQQSIMYAMYGDLEKFLRYLERL